MEPESIKLRIETDARSNAAQGKSQALTREHKHGSICSTLWFKMIVLIIGGSDPAKAIP